MIRTGKWLKRKGFCEVVLEGSQVPARVICDCGTASKPENHANAQRISALPELESLAQYVTENFKIEQQGPREKIYVVKLSQDEWFAAKRALDKARGITRAEAPKPALVTAG